MRRRDGARVNERIQTVNNDLRTSEPQHGSSALSLVDTLVPWSGLCKSREGEERGPKHCYETCLGWMLDVVRRARSTSICAAKNGQDEVDCPCMMGQLPVRCGDFTAECWGKVKGWHCCSEAPQHRTNLAMDVRSINQYHHNSYHTTLGPARVAVGLSWCPHWAVVSRLGVTDMHVRILESLCRGEEHKGESGDRHSVMTC
jgi:hypothetical protein